MYTYCSTMAENQDDVKTENRREKLVDITTIIMKMKDLEMNLTVF